MTGAYLVISKLMYRFETMNDECYHNVSFRLELDYDTFVNAYLKSEVERDASQTSEQRRFKINQLVFLGFCSKMNIKTNRFGFFEA